jgi:16S rRNA (uracil1498-N3)-methyltransferase
MTMAEDYDFRAQRLFVEAELAAGERIACARDQANYLRNVLRLQTGAPILVFNGRDGEWQAQVELQGRREVTLLVQRQTRLQQGGPDLIYLFAPLKHARLDYMVQKATEMGAARLAPVLTQHTVASRVNLERMRANAIEAAEQCGIMHIPEVAEPRKLEQVLADWDRRRQLIFCDEAAATADPIAALIRVPRGPLAVLIGPEGGFAPHERASLLDRPFVTSIALGPRIMRADTAAVAALALVNAVLGDWRGGDLPANQAKGL